MKLKLDGGGFTKLKLVHQFDKSVALMCNGYGLFTFHADGSVFAHGSIDPVVTGLQVTKKNERIKLEK
jgi:hypothetical protein